MERCSWCGTGVEADDGWRAADEAGGRVATFCRIEHVVPWTINGARWSAGELKEPAGLTSSLTECALCAVALKDAYVLLVRHRGEHRIPDAFCSPDHMAEWCKRGGRWAPSRD